MRMPGIVGPLALAAVFASAGGSAFADDEGHVMGVGVGYSSQFERAFVAVDFLVGINQWFAVVPNGSYIEADNVHRWQFGVELQWHPPIEKLHPKLLAWVGPGMSFITEDPKGPADATTRDLVVNAVAGVGWDAPASPFIQVRVTLKDPSNVGLSIGVRF